MIFTRCGVRGDYILEHNEPDIFRVPFDYLPQSELTRLADPKTMDAVLQQAADDAYRIVAGPGTIDDEERRLGLLARSFPEHEGVISYFGSLAMQRDLQGNDGTPDRWRPGS